MNALERKREKEKEMAKEFFGSLTPVPIEIDPYWSVEMDPPGVIITIDWR